jgi:hypothetical protein
MIAIFPNGDDRDACRKASSCALEINKDAEKFLKDEIKKTDQNTDFKVKTLLCIGLGLGEI